MKIQCSVTLTFVTHERDEIEFERIIAHHMKRMKENCGALVDWEYTKSLDGRVRMYPEILIEEGV